mmetsp:Transcript_112940/g.258641  ORF Transcript_112940/g.258641 Transcript_112940/m.258641 type:complete len:211 (+) Transcript_112940:942-1574(+)
MPRVVEVALSLHPRVHERGVGHSNANHRPCEIIVERHAFTHFPAKDCKKHSSLPSPNRRLIRVTLDLKILFAFGFHDQGALVLCHTLPNRSARCVTTSVRAPHFLQLPQVPIRLHEDQNPPRYQGDQPQDRLPQVQQEPHIPLPPLPPELIGAAQLRRLRRSRYPQHEQLTGLDDVARLQDAGSWIGEKLSGAETVAKLSQKRVHGCQSS